MSTPTWMVLGEAPGQTEDRKGVPFIGQAGKLLRRHLRAVGLDHNAGVYMNAVSCWPKGTPDDHHLMACRQNLIDQWEVCDAEYVLVCGSVALNALLPRARAKYARGQAIPIHGKVIYPVLHPAAILRSHRSALEPWVDELARFRSLVALGYPSFSTLHGQEEGLCLYCGHKVDIALMKINYACGKDTAKYRKDQKWMTNPGTQTSLFQT
jgi:uracil-DNA glycosylase family 4